MKSKTIGLIYLFLMLSCTKKDFFVHPDENGTNKILNNFTTGEKTRKNYNAPVLEYIVYDKYHKDSCLVQYPLKNDSIKKYPLLIMFHANVKNNKKGIYQMSGLIHQIVYNRLQVPYNFLTIMPKDANGLRSASNVDFIVEYAKHTWAVDTTKIYMTGFSAGAINCITYLTDSRQFAHKIAAAYLVSCEPVSNKNNSLFLIPKNNCHIRFMTGDEDTTCYNWTKGLV